MRPTIELAVAAVVAMAAAGCYQARFADCAIACSAASGCPDGLVCGGEGVCRLEGARGTCGGGPLGDAGDPADGTQLIDAPADAAPDAPDAAPQTITLQQTADTTAAPSNSIACTNAQAETAEDSWYRVFVPAEHGAANQVLHVQSVRFAIQQSAGQPPVVVRVGTYSGTIGATTLDLTKIAVLNSVSTTIAATATPIAVTVPVTATIPAGAAVVVEVFAASQQGNGRSVFIGASVGAETRPGYYRAPTCNRTVPTTPASVGFPNTRLIISVTAQI